MSGEKTQLSEVAHSFSEVDASKTTKNGRQSEKQCSRTGLSEHISY